MTLLNINDAIHLCWFCSVYRGSPCSHPCQAARMHREFLPRTEPNSQTKLYVTEQFLAKLTQCIIRKTPLVLNMVEILLCRMAKRLKHVRYKSRKKPWWSLQDSYQVGLEKGRTLSLHVIWMGENCNVQICYSHRLKAVIAAKGASA